MDYLKKLITDYPILNTISKNILNTHHVLKECILNGGKILTCGNGGSAADAEHIVGELMKGFRLKRELTTKQVEKLSKFYPEEAGFISQNLQQAISAISLVSSVSLSTAFANDINPDFVFAQQVYGIGSVNDVLIAISTSGNSNNVLNAAKIARTKGIKVIGLTGIEGGKLEKHRAVTIKVPANDVARIQELHLPVYHCLCSMIEETLFSDNKGNGEKLSKNLGG
jgi:D-sedoheptulose 7-phosphate isomerase